MADRFRRLRESNLVLATHNEGKLKEYAQLLADRGLSIETSAALGIQAPEETGKSLEINARLKAVNAARRSGLSAIAEDSGLEVQALAGAPGVHTADWAETEQGRDYSMAMRRVWEALEEKQTPHPRLAKFRTVICVAWTETNTEMYRGKVEGQLIWPPRGSSGFGYDPIFQPFGSQKTFGQMTSAEKNAISHRSMALRAFFKSCFAA